MQVGVPTRSVAVLVSLLVVLATLPGIVAAETRSGGSIVIGEGETIDEDLEAFGGSVVVRGTVAGDLDAFAGNVVIYGSVGGDVETAAGNVEIAPGASVGGDVEAAAGTVTIAGTVGGNVEAAAETVTLERGAEIGGNLEAAAETVRLAAGSSVAGDVEYDGRLVRADGANVAGTVTRNPELTVSGPAPFAGDVPVIPNWVFDVYGFLVNLALGALLLLAFPRFSRAVSSRARTSPLRSGGIGLLTLLAVPIALVLLALTIVGIPLTILGALAFGITAWVGAIYGRIAVGDWLARAANVENRWVGLLVGLLAVALLARIPVLGGLVELVVFLLGLGALAAVAVRRYRGGDRDADAARETGVDEPGVRPA